MRDKGDAEVPPLTHSCHSARLASLRTFLRHLEFYAADLKRAQDRLGRFGADVMQ